MRKNKQAIETLKNKKNTGPDDMNNEFTKYRGSKLTDI